MCRDPEYNDIKTKGLSTLIADCLLKHNQSWSYVVVFLQIENANFIRL